MLFADKTGAVLMLRKFARSAGFAPAGMAKDLISTPNEKHADGLASGPASVR